jgi:hypothetical protein
MASNLGKVWRSPGDVVYLRPEPKVHRAVMQVRGIRYGLAIGAALWLIPFAIWWLL